MRAYAGLAWLTVLLLSTSAFAEDPPSEGLSNALQPIGPWRVNNTQAECQLLREFGSGANALVLYLAQGAGPGKYDAVLAGTAIPKLPRRLPLELRLTPQGQVQAVDADSGRIPKREGRFVRWFDSDAALFQRLASNQQVTMSGRGGFAVSLNLKGANAAITALRTCHEKLLQSWGVDTEASKSWRALPRPDIIPGGGNPGTVVGILIRVLVPVGTLPPREIKSREPLPVFPPGAWVSSNDYPSEALRQEVSGTVTMVLSLNSAGRVENCRVVVSSRFEPLDRTSCKVLSERAKYTPALSANGDAVSATVIERIRWMIP